MKKRFVSLCLAGLIMVAPASAVFTDISDSRVSQTAAVLDALGIMQGVGGGSFAPGKALTRAQFCKLAVTAMGVTDVSPYASYTIFPDVKHSHWAAPYINAAVRHPELKEKSIIRGYADGSFGPNKIVSYGEVCTMLLRMLGYKEEDVGPFWPADYIAQAQAIGLTDGVTIADARAAVKRGDAAVLLLNALNTDKKGEEGSTLLDKVASSTIKDCILLETGKTYSALAADAALFYEDGVVDKESPRKTAGTLDSSMIGVYGTIVVGKGSSKVAVGVIPNGNKTETYEVVNAEADRIVTTNGTLRPDRKTKLYISRDHVMNEYENAWANLQSGDTLTLYYNEYGVLQLMAVLPKTTAGATHSFVYGLATSRRIPAEYTIIKNGAKIDASKLKKYDVVTLDAANRQAIVSDTKLSGKYQTDSTTYSHPSQVKILGKDFEVSSEAAATFKDMKLNDYITLLFDADGNVAAAYPKKDVSAEMQGIVTKIGEGKATVTLTNGLTLRDIKITPLINPISGQDITSSLLGRLVTVSQSGEKADLIRRTLSGKTAGNWSVAEGKLGSNAVSSKVRVYEEVLSGAPLNAINVSDIDLTSVPASQIKYTVQDNAGTVTNIVLGDVTGESWIYGIGYGKKIKGNFYPPADSGYSAMQPEEQEEYQRKHPEYYSYTYAVVPKYWQDGKMVDDKEYRVPSLPSGLNGNPIGIPRGYSTDASIVNTSLDTLKLTLIDTVKSSAFDGSSGVRTKDGYYELAENIGVYISEQNRFVSLQTAKSNYTSFRVYANKTAENGGKIRVIVAS
ncbi:S-layer homology domain-containing protein [Butyricicoccus sp. AF35-5AC]|uniref:S-layer homology domain-containing protein n=1 Tax=Butyricicoccus sp. AF35-5AC TaxID=2292003 RepID=UPI000E4FC357|nr:S-layer homology domain-containing protein [Butyricicoccus sp. AF35-5AC]RHP16627.1 S-layer homology domain-containing protein [Butyricicoccus sp. AF35-5AC]